MTNDDMVRRSLTDQRRGQTDWDRVRNQTDAEIDQAIAFDPDAAPHLDDEWLARAKLVGRI